MLGLADERDRITLRSSSKQDLSDLGAEIQTLMPGEALVTNPEALPALPARVHLYEEWLAGVPAPEPPRSGRPRPCRGSTSEPAGRHRRRPPGPGPLPGRRPGGLNQREVDFAASWHRAVEAALGLDPDAVLVLGDLFDALGPPTGRSGKGPGLRTLAEAGVPTLAISGNHDTPRLRESGLPYAVLADAFLYLRFVYRGGYEPVDLLAGLRVHAVPQCTDDLALKDQIAAAADARSGDHLNLLVTHAAVTGSACRYTYGDVNELEVDLTTLDAGFDRILLGHFHNFARVAPGPGTPARPTPSASRTCPPTTSPPSRASSASTPPRALSATTPSRAAGRCAATAWTPSTCPPRGLRGRRRPGHPHRDRRARWCGCSSTGPGPSCAACSTAASWPPTPSPAPWSSPSRSSPRRTSRPPSWPPSP